MPIVYAEVDLADFDDEDLIKELRYRGYDIDLEPSMEDVIWRYRNGYIQDAMIILERIYPELYGISKLVGEK
jgi:hypothetical protein